MSANVDHAPRKKRKKHKSSINSRSPSDNLNRIQPIDSASHNHRNVVSVGSTQSLNDKSKRRRKHKPNKNKHQQHSRYATAHTNQYDKDNHIQSHSAKKKPKKKRRKHQNKIKSRNREHRKAATTANTLNPNAKHPHDIVLHNSSATTPNVLSNAASSSQRSRQSSRQGRTASNPRAFRHKFNVTEMQLVIGQIADMKKSWKTPAEDVMDKIYQIIDMEERPHLNGKHCKVMLILDDDNYRVALLGNASEHVVSVENLTVVFETENLYSLWESQRKSSKRGGTWGRESHDDGSDMPRPPSGKPPHQDPDDMYTIQQFEHSFGDTYEFRRYDFYCIGCCIFLGIILSGMGAFLYMRNDTSNDLHAMGAFTVIFAPVLAVSCGLYIGCLWYCCAVGKGKMEYYLGKNRCFGFQCKLCDCCQYQYFIVVSMMGILIIGISIAAYLLFDKYVDMDDPNDDTDNTNPINTNTNGEVSINETKLFLFIEILSALGGLGLVMSGVSAYYCCITRYNSETVTENEAVHRDEFRD